MFQQGRKIISPPPLKLKCQAHLMQHWGGKTRLGAGPWGRTKAGASAYVPVYYGYGSLSGIWWDCLAGQGKKRCILGAVGKKCPGRHFTPRLGGKEEGGCLAAGLLSQAVCPSSPELQIHSDTCSEFRNKHIQWNSYFMRPLLGAYCKRND